MSTLICPNNKGSFDCTPFCQICEGTQEFEINEHQDGVWEINFYYEDYSINTVAMGRTKQEALDYANDRVPTINDSLIRVELTLEGVMQ
jgi:hypothetical protein